MTGTAHADNAHPKIAAAIVALEEAHAYLKSAHHDFGGHKVEAMEHVHKAIHHLKLCMKHK